MIDIGRATAGVHCAKREARRAIGHPGTTLVQHTWTRELAFHPDVHAIVTGGGLSSDTASWRPAPQRFRKSPFVVWLVAAAILSAAISTGVTIARRDPPPFLSPSPSPREEAPQEMVAGEARSVQIAGFVEQAEQARKTNDFLSCIQFLDRADALRTKPAPLDDELRKRCVSEGVAYYRALGQRNKEGQSWGACSASFAAADSLEAKSTENDPDWVDCAKHPEQPKKGPH